MCRMCLVLKDVGSCDINSVMTVQTPPPPSSTSQTQTFINDQRSVRELAAWSNNEHIFGLAKKEGERRGEGKKMIRLGFFFFLMSSIEDEAEADSSAPPRASAPVVFGTCSLLPTLKRGAGGEQDSGACPGRHRCTGGHTGRQLCRHTYTRTRTLMQDR